MEDTENEKTYYVLHYKAERTGEALHCEWYGQKQ